MAEPVIYRLEVIRVYNHYSKIMAKPVSPHNFLSHEDHEYSHIIQPGEMISLRELFNFFFCPGIFF